MFKELIVKTENKFVNLNIAQYWYVDKCSVFVSWSTNDSIKEYKLTPIQFRRLEHFYEKLG